MIRSSRHVVGIDIGGTFTDIVLLDRDTKRYRVHKLLTSSSDPSESVIVGVREILEAADVDVAQLDYVVHGTTLTANTIIQRHGARTALLVTEGFEDIIEIRKEQRYDVYDLFSKFPEPLVPAEFRIPVRERMMSDGQPLIVLDQESLREQVRRLKTLAPESVAICFLHSYANPIHEQIARQIVAEELPDISTSVSSEIVPRAGEYDRFSTTVANAYVQPVMSRYLERLQEQLLVLGCRGELYLMLSDGGMATIETARSFPVRLFESGPAAGITATARLSNQVNGRRLIAFDMGGTTAKICIVDDGAPLMTWDLEVDRAHRFSRGSGLPLRIPSIEMIEIGAGGGSLASVNELGLLKVGPMSAGSSPGPSCYGRGGDRPTVTDALLTLGFLNPDYFLGGRLALDPGKAEDAIDRAIAMPMELSIDDAALGIYRIACGQMAEAMRVHLAERGKDPRRYALVAFGGAGPVHACEVARALKIPRVVVPPAAGIISACGLLMAPLAFGVAHSSPQPLAQVDPSATDLKFERLTEQAKSVLSQAGVRHEQMQVTRFMDLKYVGQKHTIEVPLPDASLTDETKRAVVEEFERLYIMLHGRANQALEIFVEAIKVRACGPSESAEWLARQLVGGSTSGVPRSRKVRFLGQEGAIESPVLHREQLLTGELRAGPAIIEEPETTTVIGPRDEYELDAGGNLVVHVGRASRGSAVGEENRHAVGQNR